MDATKLAKELIDLHEHPREVSPFSTRYPGLTAETGYAAARQLHARRLEPGWKLLGRKNGFTNRTIWQRYGVNGPMWDAVYDRTVIFAKHDRAIVPLAGLVQPRIEPEICFKLKSPPPLAVGEIVSTGTLTDAHPVKAGETWRTSFSGIELPGLEIGFT